MKKLILLASLAMLFIFGCNNVKNNESSQAQVTEDVNATEVQNVDAILASPDDYTDKTIRISGLVTHVCKHSGQRLHLSSTDSDKKIRVEATGDISNFQRELEGSNILVQGEFKKQVINEEYLVKWESELEGAKIHSDGEHDEHEEEGETKAQKSQIEQLRQRLAETENGEIVSYWIDGKEYSEI